MSTEFSGPSRESSEQGVVLETPDLAVGVWEEGVLWGLSLQTPPLANLEATDGKI